MSTRDRWSGAGCARIYSAPGRRFPSQHTRTYFLSTTRQHDTPHTTQHHPHTTPHHITLGNAALSPTPHHTTPHHITPHHTVSVPAVQTFALPPQPVLNLPRRHDAHVHIRARHPSVHGLVHLPHYPERDHAGRDPHVVVVLVVVLVLCIGIGTLLVLVGTVVVFRSAVF